MPLERIQSYASLLGLAALCIWTCSNLALETEGQVIVGCMLSSSLYP